MNSNAGLAAFLAQVFVQNPRMLDTWVTAVSSATENEKIAVALAVWHANTSKSVRLLKSLGNQGSPNYQKYVEELMADKNPPNFLAEEISSPATLDYLWGSFYATGDARYVRRVITLLPLYKTKGNPEKLLLGGAAHWSLTSNAIQHPQVMQICQAHLKTAPEDQREVLTEVIQRAKEGKH